jgi:hypothetical protein
MRASKKLDCVCEQALRSKQRKPYGDYAQSLRPGAEYECLLVILITEAKGWMLPVDAVTHRRYTRPCSKLVKRRFSAVFPPLMPSPLGSTSPDAL